MVAVFYKFPPRRYAHYLSIGVSVYIVLIEKVYRFAVDRDSGTCCNNSCPIMAELEAAVELNQGSRQPRGRLVHSFFFLLLLFFFFLF